MKEEPLLLLSDLQKLINQVVLIDYTIIILGGGVWFALSMDRCPACKKIFAMKPGKREFLGKENVVERKEYNIYNRNHEVTGTYEKDVPVTKLYYYQWYICKYCGHKESETIVR